MARKSIDMRKGWMYHYGNITNTTQETPCKLNP